jgi:hypothetical protein
MTQIRLPGSASPWYAGGIVARRVIGDGRRCRLWSAGDAGLIGAARLTQTL